MKLFDRQINKMMNEHMPHKRRKRLIFFIAVITLLSMTTSTVAWFTINTFVGVDKLDLHISLAPQLKVAMHDYGTDLDKYVKVITNDMVDEYLATQDTKLEDIILDPVTTSDGVRFVNQGGNEREPNHHSYLEFDCYFIATEDMWVHLTTESTDNINNDGTAVTTESTGPQADVVNCTRVDFTSATNGTAIYEPNKGTPVSGQTTFDLPSGTMVYSDNTRLFHMEEMVPKKITIRIWIDGEDPECDDDVQQAQLTVQLAVVGTDDNNNPMG